MKPRLQTRKRQSHLRVNAITQQRKQEVWEYYKANPSLRKTGLYFDLSPEQVRQYIKDFPDYQSYTGNVQATKADIQALLNQGYTSVEIMDKLDISQSYLYALYRKYKLISPVFNRDTNPYTKPDLTGQVFGDWTVLKALGYKQGPGHYTRSISKSRSYYYECQCQCGVIRPIQDRYLLEGRSKSCSKCAARRRYQNS